MSHDSSVVLLGSTRSNHREVSNRKGAIAAGLAVRLKSDGSITTAKSDGETIGVSLGRDLSGTDRTAIVRKGLGVPLQVTEGFTPTIGAAVTIDDVTGMAKAAGSGVTAFNGVFASGVLTGVQEDGTEVDVCLVDYPGGL